MRKKDGSGVASDDIGRLYTDHGRNVRVSFESLSADPGTGIYLSGCGKKKCPFLLYAGISWEVQKQFQSLAEYILPKLDHEDGKAVMLGYSVYRRALEDSFHLEYIKEELYKICNSDEEDFSPYEKKKTVVQEDRMTEEEKEDNLWQMENWERASVSGNEKQKKFQRTHRSGKQTKYGSQWLDLVQHWCFFWELRQEWPADTFQE